MAACSHDMMFTFVYAGWEETANDSRVFLDALTRSENRFPFSTNDCYYVVDSSYPNIPGFLAPYRGERYHQNEFRGSRIQGKHELFNYRHSSLRGVVERTFGVLKKRFHILQSIPNYPLRRQKLIPIACCALHNFIRQEDRADAYFTMYGREGLNVRNEVDIINVVQEGFSVDMSQQQRMSDIREAIADELWVDHTRRDR